MTATTVLRFRKYPDPYDARRAFPVIEQMFIDDDGGKWWMGSPYEPIADDGTHVRQSGYAFVR